MSQTKMSRMWLLCAAFVLGGAGWSLAQDGNKPPRKIEQRPAGPVMLQRPIQPRLSIRPRKKYTSLTLRPYAAWWSTKGDKVIYAPHQGARRAHVRVYEFARKAFLRRVGKPKALKKPKQVWIHVRRRRAGKRQTVYECAIVPSLRVRMHRRRNPGGRGLAWRRRLVSYQLPADKWKLRTLAVTGKKARLVTRARWKLERRGNKQVVVLGLIPRNIKSATYMDIVFDAKEFFRKVGRKPYQTLTLWLTFTSITKRIYVPRDPRVSAPLGGFSFYTFGAVIQNAKRK